jgi:predicted AAA+ superfamily ATPase
MTSIPRIYESLLQTSLQQHRQMAFVSGPRQVGKTTVCRAQGGTYLNWDVEDHRQILTQPQSSLLESLGFLAGRPAPNQRPILVLDELHKRSRWKPWLKGLFDLSEGRIRMVVTGSSRLDLYRKGGDSLMGRYLLYRMHPLSVAELADPSLPSTPIRPPRPLKAGSWNALWEHGGFPEPFSKRSATFTRQWARLRHQQLMREDIRELTRITEMTQLEKVVALLSESSSQQITLQALSSESGVTLPTVRRWLEVLESLHMGFLVRPWAKGIANSLRKEPKWFLRDWSRIEDEGARAETAVACHLLKAAEGWTDMGLGEYELHYLRDKAKREVDFLVSRNKKPWFLVESKLSDTRLSPSLAYFQAKLQAPHAFQAVWKLDHEKGDPFTRKGPQVVPAQTLLSQFL